MLLLLPDGKRALRLYQLKEKRPGCFFLVQQHAAHPSCQPFMNSRREKNAKNRYQTAPAPWCKIIAYKTLQRDFVLVRLLQGYFKFKTFKCLKLKLELIK